MVNARWRGLAGRQGVAVADVDWDAVYAEQLPRVYSFLRLRTGDATLAEELTAQTFERAWRARAQYRHDLGAFSTWLFAIARNAAAAHFRRCRPGWEISLEGINARSDPQTVEEIVERRGDTARLRALLADLPPRERELIELKYGARLTNRAIAALMGLSESNVGTTLHRTVRRLAVVWEEGI